MLPEQNGSEDISCLLITVVLPFLSFTLITGAAIATLAANLIEKRCVKAGKPVWPRRRCWLIGTLIWFCYTLVSAVAVLPILAVMMCAVLGSKHDFGVNNISTITKPIREQTPDIYRDFAERALHTAGARN